MKVGYEIQPTRVKRDAYFEKLIIDIWTNGSIKPQDAISDASNILISHFKQFNIGEQNIIKFEGKQSEIKKNIDDISFEKIFSIKLINSLKRINIENINDLVLRTQKELALKKISEKNITEIKNKLEEIGLALRED